ncbi:hypothetical protein ACLFLN_18170 [Acinetobacter pittii]
MKASKLFKLSLGPYVLQNRIVLPPLKLVWRSTQPGNIPNELMATYYQTACRGRIYGHQGTQIEPRGQGYAWTPGIYSPEQIAGWCKVTEAVHAKEDCDFCTTLACWACFTYIFATRSCITGRALGY